MKRIVAGLAALLALTAPSLVFSAPTKVEDGRWREVALSFYRSGNPATPFPGASGSQITSSIMNGGKCGSGVACRARDTTAAIWVGDHAERDALRARTNAQSLTDTLAVFGVLELRSTSGTIDSLMIHRDLSIDGFNWTAVDSCGLGGVSVGGTYLASVLAGDSLHIKLGSITNSIDGGTEGRGSVLFYGDPLELPNRRTKYAMIGFNYVRFRINMTESDNIAAGTTGGVQGWFKYPQGK